MLHVLSTARCPRTPIALLALEESGTPYRLELKEDGWFEQTYGTAGPSIHADGWEGRGLEAVQRLLTSLPSLSSTPEDLERYAEWIGRLAELRPVLVRIGAAKRTGADPAPADAAALRAFVGDLDRALTGREWIGAEGPCAADVALVVIAPLGRMGFPVPPNVAAWLARVRSRPSWARVCAALPGAAA